MQNTNNTGRLARLKAIVAAMPEKPGSYQYYDRDKTIIYVGKAKNLKRRVSSYFHREVDRYKTEVLVSKIEDITYTVVNTEEDALLLENALIKRFNPRYNVLLKDGKTYPSICITNEQYPRIFETRRIDRGSGTYFGPYSNIGSMKAVLDVIRKTLRPRPCRTPITEEGIREGRYHTCLDYHIGTCGGCCCGHVTHLEYMRSIDNARQILKGNTREVLASLWADMEQAAEELRFEDAQRLKEQHALVAQFCAKSEVVSHTITDIDVFTCLADDGDDAAFVNFMHVVNGQICQSFTYEYRRRLNETAADVLIDAIPTIRARFASTAKEIVVEELPAWRVKNAEFFVPQRGDKAHLLELSRLNCRQYKVDRLKQTEKLNPEQRSTRLMKELQGLLSLPTLPMTIEAFDNSNIQGADAVAGCVVFRQMKPSRRDYRRYIIKTVEGPDDYASMKEVVTRRYRRMREEGTPLPDLIVCDGGAGQMGVVREAVEDDLGLKIPIAGLAKDNRHRTNELLFGFPPQTVAVRPESELFRTLTRLQDEVHRYAVTFHRERRSRHALASALMGIAGVGDKTAEALLRHFRSVKRLREATPEEIAAVVGPAKAAAVVKGL